MMVTSGSTTTAHRSILRRIWHSLHPLLALLLAPFSSISPAPPSPTWSTLFKTRGRSCWDPLLRGAQAPPRGPQTRFALLQLSPTYPPPPSPTWSTLLGSRNAWAQSRIEAQRQAKFGRALAAYENRYGLPANSATIEQVQASSAGVHGWSRCLLSPQFRTRAGPAPAPLRTTPRLKGRHRLLLARATTSDILPERTRTRTNSFSCTSVLVIATSTMSRASLLFLHPRTPFSAGPASKARARGTPFSTATAPCMLPLNRAISSTSTLPVLSAPQRVVATDTSSCTSTNFRSTSLLPWRPPRPTTTSSTPTSSRDSRLSSAKGRGRG